MRALRAEEDTLPKSTTTTPTSGGVGVDRTRGGGSEKGVIDSRAVRPPKSPASAVAGSLFSTPSRAALVSGSPSNRSNGVGIIGGGGEGAAKAAEFEAVSIAGATALGEENDGDAEVRVYRHIYVWKESGDGGFEVRTQTQKVRGFHAIDETKTKKKRK